MRVNIYAEEMPQPPRLEIIEKPIEDQVFTGLRIYLELPVSFKAYRGLHDDKYVVPVAPDEQGAVRQLQGPFLHRPGDDDSSAVTFWGKQDLRSVLEQALRMLDEHYCDRGGESQCMFVPRRLFLERQTPAEMAIRRAIDAVEAAGAEAAGADARLTAAVMLLTQAREGVADFVDGVNPSSQLGAVIKMSDQRREHFDQAMREIKQRAPKAFDFDPWVALGEIMEILDRMDRETATAHETAAEKAP
jgi:hypothetical protein